MLNIRGFIWRGFIWGGADKVEFEVIKGPKGPQAGNVRLVG